MLLGLQTAVLHVAVGRWIISKFRIGWFITKKFDLLFCVMLSVLTVSLFSYKLHLRYVATTVIFTNVFLFSRCSVSQK